MAGNASVFEAAAKAAPVASDKLEALLDLGAKAVELEQSVKDIEELIKVQKSALNEIKTKILPEAMTELNLGAFKTREGATIEINDFVAGSLPKEGEKREEALKELIEEGGQELIKTEINILFGKSAHNVALAIAADLRDKGIEFTMEEGVHPQSLLAFVRARLANGEPVETEKLGLFVGKTAKIKMAKETVKKRTRKAE